MVVSYYNFIQKKGDMQAEICAINSFGEEASYGVINYEKLLNQNKYKRADSITGSKTKRNGGRNLM
ncbi:hypothetical protein AALC25_09130 [Lachnospiraceae bacterium 29-84]